MCFRQRPSACNNVRRCCTACVDYCLDLHHRSVWRMPVRVIKRMSRSRPRGDAGADAQEPGVQTLSEG